MKHLSIRMAVLMAACCARGQGAFQYDQQVSNTNPPSGYENIQPDIRQTFIPGLSSVGFIQLYLGDSIFNNGLGSTILISLWTGSPTNGTFVSSTAPMFIPDNFVGSTNFFFLAPATVTAGGDYYFRPSVQSGDSFHIGILPGFSYANGTVFVQGVAQNVDLWFREGVVVPEPSSGLLVILGIAGVYFYRRKNK